MKTNLDKYLIKLGFEKKLNGRDNEPDVSEYSWYFDDLLVFDIEEDNFDGVIDFGLSFRHGSFDILVLNINTVFSMIEIFFESNCPIDEEEYDRIKREILREENECEPIPDSEIIKKELELELSDYNGDKKAFEDGANWMHGLLGYFA